MIKNKVFVIVVSICIFVFCACGLAFANHQQLDENLSQNESVNAHIDDGFYTIRSCVDTNFVLDAAGATYFRGTNVQVYYKNQTDAQLWKVINHDNGYIQIVNVNNGLTLDVEMGLAYDSNNVSLYYQNLSKAQLWKPESSHNGVRLVSALDSRYVLDLDSGIAANSQNIRLFSRNDTPAQAFNFNKQSEPKLDIPSFEISLKGCTLDQINAGSKDKKYEHNSLVVNDGSSLTASDDVRIKGRGNSTWDCPKKPYNIKLSEKKNLLGLGSAKNWVLLANYFDITNIKNDLTFYIAKDILHLQNSLSGEFVNLYVDNEYVGLYYLTHAVEVGKSSVNLDDDGIVVERDGWPPDDINFRTAVYHEPMIYKDSKKDSEEEKRALLDKFKQRYDSFERAYAAKNWNGIQECVDVDSFALFVLLQDYVYNGDAFGNSTFYYKDGKSDQINAGPPWDFDRAFFDYPFLINDASRTANYFQGFYRMNSRLLDVPEFRKFVDDKYRTILRDNYSLISKHVDQLQSKLKKQALKNQNKWGLGDFSHSIKQLKENIGYRKNYMDIYYGGHTYLDNGYYKIKSANNRSLCDFCKLEQLNDGYYKIINCDNGKVLDVSGNGLDLYTSVGFCDWNGTDAQEWSISQVDGSYYISSKRTGLLLDMGTDGSGSYLYNISKQPSQRFSISSYAVPTVDIPDGAEYGIVSSLDPHLGVSNNGSNVVAGSGQSINSSIFIFNKNTDGTYKITDKTSGKVLDVDGGSSDNGANVQLYKDNGTLAQKWILWKNSDNTITIKNAGSWKVLDVTCAEVKFESNIQIYQANNSFAQKWQLKESIKDDIFALAKENKGTVSKGEYTINSSINNKFCLDVARGSVDNSANVQLFESNLTNAQKWIVSEDNEGFLTIINKGSGKALDVSCGCTINSTNVQQYAANNSYAQKWIAVQEGSEIKLVSALSTSLVLDLSCGRAASGQNIQTYSLNGSKAQYWTFVKTQ